MDYGITFADALEQADMEIHAFDDELGYGIAMEAVADTGLSQNPMANPKPNQTITQTANRSRGQMGERGGGTSVNQADQKKAAEKLPKEWLDEYKAKTDAVRASKEKIQTRLLSLVQATNSSNQAFLQRVQSEGWQLQESITVLNWQYKHNPGRYLHQKVIRMRQVLDKNIQAMDDSNPAEDTVILKNNNDLEEIVMRQIGAPSAIMKYTQFAAWTQSQFRGSKAESTYTSADLNNLTKQMKEFLNIETQIKADLNEVDRAVTRLDTIVRNKLGATNVEHSEKTAIMKRLNRIGKLFAIYNNLTFMMYRLHTEFVLNRRAILRRLYQKQGA